MPPTRAAPPPPRPLLLAAAFALLGGCEGAVGPFAAANVASLAATGRDVPGLAVSAATGRDCSVAHLDRGEASYCRPEPVPPRPAPHCTRSLGAVDCWTAPPPGMPPPRPVADAPPPPPVPPPPEAPRGWFRERLGL